MAVDVVRPHGPPMPNVQLLVLLFLQFLLSLLALPFLLLTTLPLEEIGPRPAPFGQVHLVAQGRYQVQTIEAPSEGHVAYVLWGRYCRGSGQWPAGCIVLAHHSVEIVAIGPICIVVWGWLLSIWIVIRVGSLSVGIVIRVGSLSVGIVIRVRPLSIRVIVRVRLM